MQKNLSYSEHELLQHVAAGNETAFRQLFDDYWDNIYGVAFTLTRSRELSRDLVQEIFVKIWMQRQELPGKDSFRNYLFIVARNHIYSELRKKSRETAFTSHLEQFFQTSPFHADNQALYNESVSLIRQAVATLPEQQRLVYTLSREKGWSQFEIANHLQISITTVKTHMSRALTAIRNHIEQKAGLQLLVISIFEALL